MKLLNSPKFRRYLYGVLLAAFPVAVFYYPQLAPAAPLWLALAVAIFHIDDTKKGKYQAE
ncbi:hypothetical protein [Agromyces atrinae]|uniref:Uncharacterized protein n=1 Tax=Agromyces atrinae TaxID=592376 RepID=A0A4Q2M8V0_9MICO|nr:hypothetical protein [Agromyces atrinae]NYD65979.1 hypothetical protein [Agromyces atrinae]RXZ86312.1 hypothetical protein ESP50_11180 [Agromyces atrinae]